MSCKSSQVFNIKIVTMQFIVQKYKNVLGNIYMNIALLLSVLEKNLT